MTPTHRADMKIWLKHDWRAHVTPQKRGAGCRGGVGTGLTSRVSPGAADGSSPLLLFWDTTRW